MPGRAWMNHPLWRLAGRPVVFAVPFTIFFFITNPRESGSVAGRLTGFYFASLIFSLWVNTAVEANRAWVLPRLHSGRASGDEPRDQMLQVASFAVAALLGSVGGALTLHFTIAPSMLGSAAAVAQVVMYTILFTGLFLSFIYAVRYQRRYVDRIREQAEIDAREGQEMRIAAEIQQALLPPRSRSDTWYAAAGASIPCRTIGGDFFEYFDLPDGRMGFALADVAGKGPPAALLAAMVQGIFDSQARRGDGPAATLGRVNDAISAREIEARFATVFYAVLGRDGELQFSNAGHNPPFIFRGRTLVGRLETGGLMLGPFKGAQFEEGRSRLEPGDVLVVYSDGVPDAEAPDGERFGEERLLAALSGLDGESAEEIRDGLLGAVRAFVADRPPFDDVTVMTVRYHGSTSSSPPTS
ncbi:MAG TPA: PP2C family protein-serine/threonine phosphatase [Candidatus Eisenbacteria bacterium]|nr:PP2C family protein-serine/threonine phosphatase [Candidatus Eisenbacteria bacterium]